jgi:hypothetical protein
MTFLDTFYKENPMRKMFFLKSVESNEEPEDVIDEYIKQMNDFRQCAYNVLSPIGLYVNGTLNPEFEKLYSAKESVKQREKAIRNETKQKMLAKLMAQQKLTAQAPVQPTPAPTPQPIESTVGKKLRYKMNPFGGIDTFYE